MRMVGIQKPNEDEEIAGVNYAKIPEQGYLSIWHIKRQETPS